MLPLDELPAAIHWSEGLLLSPQHLQQNDIYWHHQLNHRIGLLQPHAWGVAVLDCDDGALAAQRVRLTRLQAVTPDGLLIQFPGNHGTSLELDLTQAEWPLQGGLRVSLVVPVRDKGAATPGSPIQRFDAMPGQLECDETLPESRIEVGRLRPRVALLAGAVPPRYTAVPLLEVVRDAGGNLRLGDYHPPCLHLQASAFLGAAGLTQRLRTLATAMRHKIRDLAGSRRLEDNIARLDHEARRALFVARHLAMGLPAFELMLADPAAHPQAVYLELARLAGCVAALAANPTPPLLPSYLHDHLRAGFDAAIAFIETRLRLVNPLFEAMLFDRETDARFTRYLPEGLDCAELIIELRPRKGQSSAALTEWIAQAQIASVDRLATLALRRLPGAGRTALDLRQLPGLNVSDGALVFRIRNAEIDLQDQPAPAIRAGSRLAIQGSGDALGPMDIVLHQAVAAAPQKGGQAHA